MLTASRLPLLSPFILCSHHAQYRSHFRHQWPLFAKSSSQVFIARWNVVETLSSRGSQDIFLSRLSSSLTRSFFLTSLAVASSLQPLPIWVRAQCCWWSQWLAWLYISSPSRVPKWISLSLTLLLNSRLRPPCCSQHLDLWHLKLNRSRNKTVSSPPHLLLP